MMTEQEGLYRSPIRLWRYLICIRKEGTRDGNKMEPFQKPLYYASSEHEQRIRRQEPATRDNGKGTQNQVNSKVFADPTGRTLDAKCFWIDNDSGCRKYTFRQATREQSKRQLLSINQNS